MCSHVALLSSVDDVGKCLGLVHPDLKGAIDLLVKSTAHTRINAKPRL